MQTKLIFFGNGSHYSIAVLDNLLEQGIKPVALALPEYPPSAFSEAPALHVDQAVPVNKLIETASRLSIPLVYAPEALISSLADKLAEFGADYILVACWPYLLVPAVVAAIGKAALNLHPSLLPAYRGPDPVAEQLACKESRLGVSLHRLSQQFDRGEIVRQAGFDLGSVTAGRDAIEAEAAHTGTALFIDFLSHDMEPEGKSRPGLPNAKLSGNR